MTDAAAAPEVATEVPNTAPAPAPDASAPGTSADPESAPPTEADPSEPKPEAKPERLFTQEELNRAARRERKQAEERAYTRARLELENERLRQQLGQPRGDAPTGQTGNGERPRPEQFKDWDAYNEALVDWKVGAHIKQVSEGARQVQATTAVQQYAQAVQAKLAAGAEKYEDFEDAVTAPGVVFTDPMVNALLDVPAPHDVAYFLGTHPQESQRIGALSPAAQVREIDKISAQLSKPPAATKAPAPIKPNLGTGGVEKSLEDAAGNYQEWLKIRNRQLAQKG